MDVNDVAKMILQGMTHREISDLYKNRYPDRRGYSERSVRRFCKLHDLHKPTGAYLDNIVKASVQEVKRSFCIDSPKQNMVNFTGWTYVWQKNAQRCSRI